MTALQQLRATTEGDGDVILERSWGFGTVVVIKDGKKFRCLFYFRDAVKEDIEHKLEGMLEWLHKKGRESWKW